MFTFAGCTLFEILPQSAEKQDHRELVDLFIVLLLLIPRKEKQGAAITEVKPRIRCVDSNIHEAQSAPIKASTKLACSKCRFLSGAFRFIEMESKNGSKQQCLKI